MLQSSSVEEPIPVRPEEVYEAVLAVAAALWNVGEADIVTRTPPSLLVHSVRLDDQISCWLSWEIEAVDCGSSRVRLLHDEADTRPGPAPELSEVMTVLRRQLERSASR